MNALVFTSLEVTDQDMAAKREQKRLANQRAIDWIAKMEATHHRHPLNNSQLVIGWGEGNTQQLGIFELETSFISPGAVEIKWFQGFPMRQGVGTKLMKELQRLAKEDGIKFTLYAWDKGVIGPSKLVKFYKSVGFKPVLPGSRNMHWDPSWD